MATLRSPQFLLGLGAALHAWAEVLKWSRCLPVALSAGFGAMLYRPVADTGLAVALLGVLLLAWGCAGLNSVQESRGNARFRRTCHRPLVTGRLSRTGAFWLSCASVGFGLALLASGPQPRLLPPALGLTALLLYNGVYTPLKPITVLALIPGGLAGGLPPLIGWTSAGGALDDPRAFMLLSLFFLWQIPHYCLIVLHHQTEYRTGPYPSLIRLFPEAVLRRITLLWILALMVAALTLAAVPHLLKPGPRWLLVVALLLLTGLMSRQLCGSGRDLGYRRMLQLFNACFFVILTLVSLGQLMVYPAGFGL